MPSPGCSASDEAELPLAGGHGFRGASHRSPWLTRPSDVPPFWRVMIGTVRVQSPEQRVGESLNGKWHLERLVGVGGMGAVYEPRITQAAAAPRSRSLHARYATDENIRKEVLARGVCRRKQIDHPGAVAILDDDLGADESPFLVMELLEGESLSERLQRTGGYLAAAETRSRSRDELARRPWRGARAGGSCTVT